MGWQALAAANSQQCAGWVGGGRLWLAAAYALKAKVEHLLGPILVVAYAFQPAKQLYDLCVVAQLAITLLCGAQTQLCTCQHAGCLLVRPGRATVGPTPAAARAAASTAPCAAATSSSSSRRQAPGVTQRQRQLLLLLVVAARGISWVLRPLVCPAVTGRAVWCWMAARMVSACMGVGWGLVQRIPWKAAWLATALIWLPAQVLALPGWVQFLRACTGSSSSRGAKQWGQEVRALR